MGHKGVDFSPVHDALQTTFLKDGEVLVRWAVTMEIMQPDGLTYLAHRSGEGSDGNVRPAAWTILGLLRSRLLPLEDQLRGLASRPDD